MKQLLFALLLLSNGAVALVGCDGDGPEDQTGSNVELSVHKIKSGASAVHPGLTYGLCKSFVEDAQQFFGDQPTGFEREVFAIELQTVMAAGTPLMIVDVRPASDYSAAHIPTSVNIPLDTLFEQGLCLNGAGKQCDGDNDDLHCKTPVLPTDGTPIVLVSSNGHAAALAAGMLGTLGYNVFALRFGMIAWSKSTDVQFQRPDKTQRIQGLGGALTL